MQSDINTAITYNVLLLLSGSTTEKATPLLAPFTLPLQFFLGLLPAHLSHRFDIEGAGEALMAKQGVALCCVATPALKTIAHIWVQAGSMALDIVSHLLDLSIFLRRGILCCLVEKHLILRSQFIWICCHFFRLCTSPLKLLVTHLNRFKI